MTTTKRNGEERVTMGSGFFFEGRRAGRGMSLFVGGVTDVLEYSDSTVRLKTGRCTVTLSGSALTLVFYEGDTVEVRGRWEAIRFDGTKNS